MADNPPNVPSGVPPAPVPPKPAEASKVQPKKETVRISLPPKPTASPTIKLPTLPVGGPIGSAAPPPPSVPISTNLSVAVPPSTGGATPAPPRPPTSPGTTQATLSRPATSIGGPRPAAPAAPAAVAGAQRPAPVGAARKSTSLSGLDVGLAIAAGVVALGAIVSVLLLLQIK